MKKSVEGAFLIAPTFLIGELDAAGAIFPHQEHRCGRWSYNSHFVTSREKNPRELQETLALSHHQ